MCPTALITILLSSTLLLQLMTTDAMKDAQLDELWTQYKQTHNKVYDVEEDFYRRQVWSINVDHINLHNIRADMGQYSYTLGVNQFTDLTLEEYKKRMLGGRVDNKFVVNASSAHSFSSLKFDLSELPGEVDWVGKGCVTPVKDQGQCGSCWAFSATGVLESQQCMKTGRLVSLSEQQLVDCSTDYGNEGCNGGNECETLQYIADNGGVDTEDSYPYETEEGECRFESSSVGAKCTGVKYVTPAGNEKALQAAVAKIGPIAIAIDAGHPDFQNYKGGVYDDSSCTTDINHAVLLVGYGTYKGVDYWLVKNSWGTSWGIDGYIRMARNKNNQCGIANYCCYPTL